MKARSRTGFTLIELMVAMALTLFIMVILSQAFVMALETFSGMKGLGDMQYNLRTAMVMVRDDLSQDHFEGKRRLSDLTVVNTTGELVAHHPQAGFFALRRPAPGPLGEGGANGVTSYRAVDQVIYMTVKRKGNRQENFFNTALQGSAGDLGLFFSRKTAYDVPFADLPFSTQTQPYLGGTTGFYASQWAEVLYFLVRTGSTEQPNDPASTLGTKTYALYRAQFVMVPDGTNVNDLYKNPTYTSADIVALSQSTFSGLSCNPNKQPGATALTFYSPEDAARGQRVILDLAAFNAADPRIRGGATLVCPNVISFLVQSMFLPSDNDGDDVPTFGNTPNGIYDTTKFGIAPYTTLGLKGIQVTLRVWDNTTRQTRQATLAQDL
jgi:prepilin-type N-terminal cleavage/methylation domain-containing protein